MPNFWISLDEIAWDLKCCPEKLQMTPKKFTWIGNIIMSHLNPLWGLLGIHRGLKGAILPPKNPLLWEKLLSEPGPKSQHQKQRISTTAWMHKRCIDKVTITANIITIIMIIVTIKAAWKHSFEFCVHQFKLKLASRILRTLSSVFLCVLYFCICSA